MKLPIRPLKGRWPARLQRRAARFFWDDPRALLDDDVDADTFRRLMSAIHVGDTIKITEANRHPGADRLLVESVDLTGAHIVDIGCSDGSTAVDLIRSLPTFGHYTMTDLHLHVDAVDVGRRVCFLDSDGTCILIAGRRTIAWPTLSRLVSLLYSRVIRRAESAATRHPVLLLNPRARALVASDDRITYRSHDVFTPWRGRPADVIKVANLLRRFYFDDAKLGEGVRTVLASLPDGGHFLVVDNGRDGYPPRAGLYRRSGTRFDYVGNDGMDPEIHNLVMRASLS